MIARLSLAAVVVLAGVVLVLIIGHAVDGITDQMCGDSAATTTSLCSTP